MFRHRHSARAVLLLVFAVIANSRADYAPNGISSLWFHGHPSIQRLQDGWSKVTPEQPGNARTFSYLLPTELPPHPVLVVANPGSGRLDISVSGQALYGFGESSGIAAPRAANAVHRIPLSLEASGQPLTVRFESADAVDPTLGRPMILLASATDLTQLLQWKTLPGFGLALLFLMTGLYAGMAWLVRRRYGLHFSPWLAVLTGTTGLAMLISSAMEFMPPTLAARIYYPGLLFMLLFPAALWRFMEESLGRGRWSLIRRCWQLQLIAAAALWLPDVLGLRPFATPAQILGNGLIALQLCVGLSEGLRHVCDTDPSRRWTARGILVFSLAGLVDILVSFYTGNPDVELYPFGLLTLIALLAWNQERAAGEAQQTLRRQAQELRQHRDQLEQRVRQRTIELEEATLKAESASRAKGDFLANMSHEVRTPLNAILGHAQRLHQKNSDPDTLERANVIQESANHLLALINDILDLSRIEAGRLSLETGECDLPGLLETLIRMLQPRAEEKGLTLTLACEGPLPSLIETDATRLRQILINLLGNGIKFTDQGCVTLQVELQESLLLFEVRDTGPGWGPDGAESLFEPFERQHQDSRQEGTGLGLAISRRLARAMNGDLTAVTHPEGGSSFHLRLPCTVPESAAPTLPVVGTDRLSAKPSHPGPLPPDYQPLRDALSIGDISTLQEHIPLLREHYPEHNTFLDKLEHLAKNFDIAALQHALDPDS
jgi:signal transduction histidine kinase